MAGQFNSITIFGEEVRVREIPELHQVELELGRLRSRIDMSEWYYAKNSPANMSKILEDMYQQMKRIEMQEFQKASLRYAVPNEAYPNQIGSKQTAPNQGFKDMLKKEGLYQNPPPPPKPKEPEVNKVLLLLKG